MYYVKFCVWKICKVKYWVYLKALSSYEVQLADESF